MKRHAAPIIAAILLLLPVLHVGSYLALVVPKTLRTSSGYQPPPTSNYPFDKGYGWAMRLFWPIEQIDRKIRPKVWEEIDLIRALT